MEDRKIGSGAVGDGAGAELRVGGKRSGSGGGSDRSGAESAVGVGFDGTERRGEL